MRLNEFTTLKKKGIKVQFMKNSKIIEETSLIN